MPSNDDEIQLFKSSATFRYKCFDLFCFLFVVKKKFSSCFFKS